MQSMNVGRDDAEYSAYLSLYDKLLSEQEANNLIHSASAELFKEVLDSARLDTVLVFKIKKHIEILEAKAG